LAALGPSYALVVLDLRFHERARLGVEGAERQTPFDIQIRRRRNACLRCGVLKEVREENSL